MSSIPNDPYRSIIIGSSGVFLFFFSIFIFSAYALLDVGVYSGAMDAALKYRIAWSRLQSALLNVDVENPDTAPVARAYAAFVEEGQEGTNIEAFKKLFPAAAADLQIAAEEVSLLVAAYLAADQALSTQRVVLPRGFIEKVDAYLPVLQEKKENVQAFYLSMQVHLVVLILAFFMLTAVFFFNRLRLSDRETRLRAQETEIILDNVGEGLLLLNRDLKITEKFSRSLPGYLNTDPSRIQDRSFIDLLEDLVSEKTMKTAGDYIALLFQKHVKQKLISSLNPLERVTTTQVNEMGEISNRYLSFRFNRALDDLTKAPLYVLVTIADITDQVVFEERIKELEKNAQSQLDLFLKIVHLEPDALLNALKNNEYVLLSINQDLKGVRPDNSGYLRLLQEIRPQIHTLKGNAGLLNLDILKSYLHEFENIVFIMESKGKQLRGEDFIVLATQLNKLLELVSTIQKIAEKMQKNNLGLAKNTDDVFGQKRFQRLVADIATKHGKTVTLEMRGVQDLLLPHDKLFILQNVFIQLLSNAVIHGIEAPDVRLKLGKSNPAAIKITAQQKGTKVGFVIKDDGQGIDVEKIRLHLQVGNPQQDWASLTQAQLLEYIFKPGFSMAENLTEDAGRGIGMLSVRENLSAIGASIYLKTEPQKYTAWQIVMEI